MAKKIIKFLKIISCIVISAVLMITCWLGYKYWTGNPDAKETTETPAVVSETDSGTENQYDPAELLPSQETVKVNYLRVTQDTYLRTKAESNAPVILSLRTGTELKYISEKGNYYNVECNDGKEGWVIKTYSEIFEKELTVTHVPKRVINEPFSINGTIEGNRLDEILNNRGTVGASVAVIKNGRVSYHYEYGYANMENMIPVTQNTKFRVASLSKVFTAMLAMSETDEGNLDLDSDLSRLFGFKFHNPDYPEVTVTMRMLLTHTSGLTGKEGQYYRLLPEVTSSEEFYTSMPGYRFSYSNLGIGIAGAVVEKASGKTLSRCAKDKFLSPMGIDASFDANYLSDKSLVADCYYYGTLRCTNEFLTRPQESKYTKPGETYHLGQGGLLISATDYAKLSTLLLNNGVYEGNRYLSEKAVTEMLAVQNVNTNDKFKQCLGIRKYTGLLDDRDMYYHTGNAYGIFALMAIDPRDGSGVVIITSGSHTGRDDNTIYQVCNQVLDYVYKEII